MAKLVDVYRNDSTLGRRQLPLIIDENLTMVMDLNPMGLLCENGNLRGKELDEIVEKMKLLSVYELKTALKVSIDDIRHVLDQAVPCVGCRRSVDRLFFQILRSGFPTLDPLMITKGGVLTIREDKITPNVLGNLFHGHATRLNDLVDSQPRSKKSRRCLLHSLESQRPRPVTPAWRDVWDCMRTQCKEEVVLIEASSLHATLENYLRKHRFCGECRTKVLRAYTLLVEEPEPNKEKGYVASLYSGIKRCIPDKHLHLQTKTDYIANLIVRAEPEIMGSRRERHAKTLEIAQEEVLTCLGICIYERLHRVYMRLREEECTCQVLAAVAVDCLCRSFETAVEVKRGVTRLEQLYQELTREEQQKIQRKENKKLKRRRKKERKAENEEKENCEDCQDEIIINNSNDDLLTNEYLCAQVKDCMCISCGKKNKNQQQCHTGQLKELGKKPVEQLNGNHCNRTETINNSCNRKKSGGKSCAFIAQREVKCTILDEKCDNNLKSSDNNISSTISSSTCQSCQCENSELTDTCKLERTSINEGWSSNSEHSQDCGYSSENNNGCCDTASGSLSLPSSPEGSEVACSEGFCNHDGGECHMLDRPSSMLEFDTPSQTNDDTQQQSHHNHSSSSSSSNTVKLSLEQMLDSCSSDEDGGGEGGSYISAEEVLEFKSKVRHLTEKRQELRQTLKTRFAQLCFNIPQTQPRVLAKPCSE